MNVPNACLVLLRSLVDEGAWVEALQFYRMFKHRLETDANAVSYQYILDHFAESVKKDLFGALDQPLVCVALRNHRREHKILAAYIEEGGVLKRVNIRKQCYHIRGLFMGRSGILHEALEILDVPICQDARAGRAVP